MYAQFLRGLADLADAIDATAKIGSDGPMPTPYIGGRIDVLLEGEVVGHFLIEDEYCIYEPKENK